MRGNVFASQRQAVYAATFRCADLRHLDMALPQPIGVDFGICDF